MYNVHLPIMLESERQAVYRERKKEKDHISNPDGKSFPPMRDIRVIEEGVLIVQALISVQALVFDLAQLTCQKRFDCRNAILGSSAILLGTSYS